MRFSRSSLVWTAVILKDNDGVTVKGILGVAIYDRFERRDAATRTIESLARFECDLLPSLTPSRIISHFPLLRSDLERRLEGMGNAMSILSLREPLWCNEDIPISTHMKHLRRLVEPPERPMYD